MKEKEVPHSFRDESPVFIVGPLRSGTTLLRLLLDHHPDICIFGEFEAAVSQANGEEWPEISAYREFLKNDRQTKSYGLVIRDDLEYRDLVLDLFEQIASRTEKSIVGAAVHSRMDLIPKLWPHARYIHLLRDPRDVAKSCIGMGWVGNVYEGAYYWVEPERHWDIVVDTVPVENVLTVKYEDLVDNPDLVLTQACRFLGTSFDPEMLEIDKDTTYSRPDSKLASQWQKSLSRREINWVESRCSIQMKKRGYESIGTVGYKPGVLEMLWIKTQNRIYRITFNIRRWGLKNWIYHVFAKRYGTLSMQYATRARIDREVARFLK